MLPNENKNKHMTLQDRIEIQECLSKGMTFKAIALRLGKAQTTISREVKLHQKAHVNGFVKSDEVCPRLLKAPFVCNGCSKRSNSGCRFKRQIYDAQYAQRVYETTLVDCRTGIALNKESFYETERILSNAVRNGQHIYHAIKSNNLPVSSSTVYRHIKARYYTIGVLDLPRAVKFKPRKTIREERIPNAAKTGRTYEDFLAFTEENSELPITELDTVIGRVGGRVILTLHFDASDFMIGLLLENKSSAEVAEKIQKLKRKMSDEGFSFGDLIPVLLTDNGGEFSRVSALENDPNGDPETSLFFCDPATPNEKPHIEKNHTLFRDIVPSGSSFDDFTQDTVNLIFSHVNAVKRKQFNGKSAYDMFAFSYSAKLAETLGISFVEPQKVVQSPALLK